LSLIISILINIGEKFMRLSISFLELFKPRWRFFFAVFTGLFVNFNTVYVQASSFTVDALTLAQESVLNQSYTVRLTTTQLTPNGNTLASDRQLRYCIDGDIAINFNYTLTLNNGATWGETLTVDSFWVENSEVSFKMAGGGGSDDSDVTFSIMSGTQPISTGVCLVLKDFAINIPVGIEDDIEVTAELKTPFTNIVVNPPLTTTIIDLIQQFGFEITAPASSEIDSSSTPPNTQFVEEGAADDVLTSHSDTDLLTSAAGYSFINRRSEIEDPIALSAEDKLRLTLTPSSVEQLNQISQVVIELDGDGMSPGSADVRQTFISNSTNGQLVAEIMGSKISNQTISDDIVLLMASENSVIDDQTFNLTAQLYFYTGDILSLYEDSATEPAFSLFKLTQPGFISNPVPNSTIEFASTTVGTSVTQEIVLEETGNATLQIEFTGFTGAHAADFQLTTSTIVSIDDGGMAEIAIITCTPSQAGEREAVLNLQTNDPNPQTITYSLICPAELPVTNCNEQTELPLTECESLIDFYNQTNGTAWTDNATNNWNVTNQPCSWTGIQCTDGHVTHLQRDEQNLTGTLSSLEGLPWLQVLSLTNNQLTGTIPSLNTLTQLKEIQLQNNQFTGEIPALNVLSQLERLILSNNQLTGTLSDLTQLVNLTELDVTNNQLTGPVPSLNALKQLVYLRLSNNEFTGDLPDFQMLSHLVIVQLANNHFTGTIPDFTSLTDLQELSLAANQLSGEISLTSSLLNQLNLTLLDLSYNKLSVQNLTLINWLLEKAPNWFKTQTIPPSEVQATALSATEIEISWRAIPYVQDGGYYQVKMATTLGNSYRVLEKTFDKTVTQVTIPDVKPNTTYWFAVETYTPAHARQKNVLISSLSEIVKVTTPPLLGPMYSSTPAPGSLIAVGNSEVGTPTTTTPLTVLEIGDATLEITSSQIIGEQAVDFRLFQGAAPFSIADGGLPHTILIQCIPGAVGLRTAELILTSNDPANSYLNYSLNCTGNSTPKFNAQPAPGTLIDFGATFIGTPINTTIEISTTETLEILSAEISGAGAEVFQLVGANFPFSLTLDKLVQNLVLECLPTVAGVYSAQLQLETNDPNYLTVTYPLTCLGEAGTIPRLDSTPPPNTILDFGAIPIDSTVTRSILFQASDLVEKLQVTTMNITGSHADDFTVIYGLPPFSITTENPDYVMIVQCHPGEVGIHRAFLNLTMPELNPAEMRYTLHCVGESESPEKSIFSGEIRTQAGAVGENLTIHEPEQIKITGLIQPADSHLEQLADLIFIYHWTPVDDETISIPITFAHQVPLAAKMDWVLFEGYAIGFAGHFELELGYRLNTDEFYSDTIAQLEVIPNQAPTDILLDGNTVAENSPLGTVIGSFTTVDADKGEWFFYGLTDNPGGYFTVIGNELQVANGAILNYENGENYPITVRSVDASGDYLEKTFTIQVTDVVATPDDVRLTNKYVLEQSIAGTAVARLITESSERASYQYELIDDAEGRFYLQDDILLVADSQALDFETQTTHDITVRSQATEIPAQIEKTFTIELINVIDMAVTSEIRDANEVALSTATIPTHQPVKIIAHLTPDAEHQGREAEMMSVVFYFQAEQLIGVFALDEAQQWQLWDGHLLTLPSYQRQTLPKKAEWLFHGSFPNEFAGSRLEIYLGYRLIATGELVYSPQQAVMIKIGN
jgi:hypothetical protein